MTVTLRRSGSVSRGPALALLLGGAVAGSHATGCVTSRYLWQAAWGQLDLQSRAEPIARVLATGQAPARLRAVLLEVDTIKAFGARHGLAISSSYDDYAELDRDAAVWVVTACAPLRFSPKIWRFPLVGSFPYLGWFDPEDAAAYADSLAREGWDVYVRGTPAYSTLGWFRDPLLSTMLAPGPTLWGDLVDTVLHEAVHATVHVPGQAYFNESAALFVAEGLTPLYLAERFGADAPEARAYREDQQYRAAREQFILAAHEELSQLYDSDREPADKLERKEVVLRRLQAELGTDRRLNNAFLEGFRTYRVGHQRFAHLLSTCGGDWVAFVETLKRLQAEAFPAEQSEAFAPTIDLLARAGCAARR